MMNDRAYAVGFIDTRTEPPLVTGVGIFSDNAGGITTDHRKAHPFDITEACGETYDRACGVLEAHLEKLYPWAYALLRRAEGK